MRARKRIQGEKSIMTARKRDRKRVRTRNRVK